MPALSLKAYESLASSGTLYGQLSDDLTALHESGQFTISAVGGFDTSSFTIRAPQGFLDDFYEDGLMRRVEWLNPEGIQIWEGYVHRIRYQTGQQEKTKSVENYFNRVYMAYSPLLTDFSPPVELPPELLILDDPEGQTKYGVKSVVISGGGRADDTAYDWARTVLKDRKKVPIGRSVSTGSGSIPQIQIEAQGYYHALKWLPYIKTATGKIQAHQVIQEILEYFHNINPWLSLDFGWMDYNFRRARRGYDELLSCWDVIENIISEGGAGGERWVGGFYQDRQFIYKPAEDIEGLYASSFELYQALGDPAQFIYDTALGAEVKPWDMTPDQVLHTVDSNVGGDRDLMYIEQITYSEPYGLQLVGEDDQRLKVYLAQRGLPGA